MFRPIPDSSKQTHGETEVTCEFRNDTRRVVSLPTYFLSGPKDGVLRVSFTQYEVQVAGEWESLDIGYDGIPNYIPVEPGNELRLLISLGPFEYRQVSRDAPLRVRLGEFTSDVFTLNRTSGGQKDPPQSDKNRQE